MGVALQILVGIIAVVLLIVLVIIVIRGRNTRRFETKEVDNQLNYYSEPNNLSLYPTDLPNISVKHIEGNYLNSFHLKPNDKVKSEILCKLI